MASIFQGAVRMVRELARLNVHPLVVAVTGFLTATLLMTFYWQAEAADRAHLSMQSALSSKAPGFGPTEAPLSFVFWAVLSPAALSN